MTPAQIEAWVLSVVERVTSGGRAEDDRVECKAIWPDPPGGAARQLAGQLNAARGALLLWIIGLDEKAHRVTDPGDVDTATWWAQVEKRFAELAPALRTLSVPVEGGRSVMALLFESDRAPYLITTDGHQGVQREVPWRSGTGTRTAHRRELLQMLVPASPVPTLELISANLEGHVPPPSGDPPSVEMKFSGGGKAFFDATGPAMLPSHLNECTAAFSGLGGSFEVALAIEFNHAPTGRFLMGRQRGEITEAGHPRGVTLTSSGIYIDGPGALHFDLWGTFPHQDGLILNAAASCLLSVSLAAARTGDRVRAQSHLERKALTDERRNYWVFGPQA